MTTWAPCRCGQPMRDGTCCCDYCVGAYDHQPDAPDHRAALTGCVGTGAAEEAGGFGDSVRVYWYAPKHQRWRFYDHNGERLSTCVTGPRCTADAAVLAGGER